MRIAAAAYTSWPFALVLIDARGTIIADRHCVSALTRHQFNLSWPTKVLAQIKRRAKMLLFEVEKSILSLNLSQDGTCLCEHKRARCADSDKKHIKLHLLSKLAMGVFSCSLTYNFHFKASIIIQSNHEVRLQKEPANVHDGAPSQGCCIWLH